MAYPRVMKEVNIPIQYAQIVHQFLVEKEHGTANPTHESLHRQTYVEKMLDAFGVELDAFKGEESQFCSAVLTLVLQCQLQGVPNVYGPSIRNAIAPVCGAAEPHTSRPTILQVTNFYLRINPLDPKYIQTYRWNLIYVREA